MAIDPLLSRRTFLRRLVVWGTAGVGAGTVLAASTSPFRTHIEPCDDTSDLTEQEIKTRESLKYTSDSPHETKTCNNCRFYEEPKTDDPCGTCQVVKGPIHPDGYCTAWAEGTE